MDIVTRIIRSAFAGPRQEGAAASSRQAPRPQGRAPAPQVSPAAGSAARTHGPLARSAAVECVGSAIAGAAPPRHPS